MALFEAKKEVPSNLLRDRYVWPPFSVLNTSLAEWQHRRKDWIKMIGDSTDGRDTKRYNATPTNIASGKYDGNDPQSVSTFDPVLAELMYRWFSRKGDCVLDPFAGGNVRGVVGACLGRAYLGIDLSPEQVEVNRNSWQRILDTHSGIEGHSIWFQGDSEQQLEHWNKNVNMVFTCPPYYNLEKYSNNPNDLSNLKTYELFLQKYGNILRKSVDVLAQNSFFVIVVSEIRADSHGVVNSYYRGLVPDTIHILRDICNIHYYNEIILENSAGSLPLRAPKIFDRSRKIGRMHQNVLVFFKGDLSAIEEKFGKVSVT